MRLGERDGVVGDILGDLDVEQEGSESQVTKLEVLGQFSNSGVHDCVRPGDKCDVINEDRNNDPDISLAIDVHRAVRLELGIAQGVKDIMELLVSLPGCLLEAIEGLGESAHMVRPTLVIAFRLAHVDLFL